MQSHTAVAMFQSFISTLRQRSCRHRFSRQLAASSARRSLHMVSTAEKAVSVVESGDCVFIHGAMNTPQALIRALAGRAGPELKDVRTVSIHTEGDVNPLVAPEAAVSFRHNALFCGPNVRRAVNEGRADFTPCFLSDIPNFFRKRVIPVDVAMVKVRFVAWVGGEGWLCGGWFVLSLCLVTHLCACTLRFIVRARACAIADAVPLYECNVWIRTSPPDRHGYCSLGTSVDVACAACEVATTIIAEVCPDVPRTHGDSLLHESRISFGFENTKDPVWHSGEAAPSTVHREIGNHVAGVINDYACIQAGIGNIPDATFLSLRDRKGLGIHTEMFSDSLLDLMEAGVVTNERKKVFPGSTSFDLEQCVALFSVAAAGVGSPFDSNRHVLDS